MEDRLTYYENARRNVDAQIQELLLTHLELSYRLYSERVMQGQLAWDAMQDGALLAEMTAGLPHSQAEMMYQIWSLILQEDRKQYFLHQRARR